VDATIAFSGIRDHLTLAKDGTGHFYNPEWDFSNMGDLSEGQGYLVKVDGDVELRYQIRLEEEAGLASVQKDLPTQFLPSPTPTNVNMSLLVLNDAGMTGEIGVYAGDILVGSAVLADGKLGLAIWGDDPTTESIDGAISDQLVWLIYHDGSEAIPVEYNILEGESILTADSFLAIKLSESGTVPTEFGITSAYPNPFNHQTKLSFTLAQSGKVDILVYDINGREIMSRSLGNVTAGNSFVTIDGDGFTSGIYFVELRCNGMSDRMKVVMLK
jgi:hypothetical protein